jgi:threonine synthase
MPAVPFAAASVRPSIRSSRTARARSASAHSTRLRLGPAPRRVSRASIEAGPPSIWRYADLLPVDAPTDAAARARHDALVPAPGSPQSSGSASSGSSSTPRNPTHSFKDRVVAVAAAEGAGARARHALLLVDRQPRRRRRGTRAAEGLDAALSSSRRPRAGEARGRGGLRPAIYAVDGTYDHCSRLSVELSFELPWGFVNVNLRSYYAEGSKTLAYEIAEQLGWETPDAVAIPIASGALFHKVGQGFASCSVSA